ncbi:portal protein [Marinivivus vitaminiproducens]|uniref:portal protein n=1 Tax=Marinivivus vitaminiproducens TaxID=3035935 RepID=UPI0027A3366E|nr:portal protein [Geminicoccaceae bacterium SCSIO 64248]
MPGLPLDELTLRYQRARNARNAWEPLWRDCLSYAMPYRSESLEAATRPDTGDLFDGTAPDAVQQLAASLMAELTPPWSRWFSLVPGPSVPEAERPALALQLEAATRTLHSQFDRSNYAVELHQCFLDLVVLGTATLVFEESPIGAPSAFRFGSLPQNQVTLEHDPCGEPRRHFRSTSLDALALCARFPSTRLPPEVKEAVTGDPERRFVLVESVRPEGAGFAYVAFVEGLEHAGPLAEGAFEDSPFISFRWLKGAGETYGRSPVMTALPDIRTANTVVELVLKNASIAVTGIWQADDDGVLNPANIRLVPGSIIPKAVGSSGLTPLQTPGRFDVSELVLDDLRRRIRHTLLVDRLGPVAGRMTATEVLVRSREMARLLGATYGRLQAELLRPLVGRAVRLLRRRGEIPDIRIDGRTVELRLQSPLARAQARDDVENTLLWLEAVAGLGADAAATVDKAAAARWLGETLGVPAELIRDDDASRQA